VLYVHPFGHPEDDVLPVGLVGLVNALPIPKLGVYPHELTPELVRCARVLLMDIHWYHGLWGARAVSRAVRSAAPDTVIVVGGYTASAMAESLVLDEVADFVVVGDAERPLPELLRRLATGSDVHDVPNLVGKGFRTLRNYVLTEQDYARSDSQTIDWFPSLWAKVASAHAVRPILTKHPAVPIYKGCSPLLEGASAYCTGCWGQPRIQRQLTGRALVHRAAADVRADLVRLSTHSVFKRVHLFDDPISMLGEAYAAELFRDRYDLELYMEPHRFFSTSLLEQMASAFNRVELMFYHQDLAKTLARRETAALGFLECARDRNIKISLCAFERTPIDLEDTAREFGVEILRNEDEILELPDPFAASDAAAAGYQQFLAKSQSFAVLKLMSQVTPAYLDVAAVQLGLCADSVGLMTKLSSYVDAPHPVIGGNPLFRDVMSGANRMDLAFFAAPYARRESRSCVSIERTPQSALLASPEPIEAVTYELRERAYLEVHLEFRYVCGGIPRGLAINFVSRKPRAMVDLHYDRLWKLCIPLASAGRVHRGDTARLRLRIATVNEPPLRVHAEWIQ
jgi:hypothetical protein